MIASPAAAPAVTEAMRALVLVQYGTMAAEERPAPVARPGEALVEVVATGICGSDLHGFTGENGRRSIGQVMGHETVGRVVGYGGGTPADAPGIGAVVTVNPTLSCGDCPACREGDAHICPHRRVIGVNAEISSAFADLLVVPAANLVPLEDGMSILHGALVEPLAVGYHAARRSGIRRGDSVLIVGAGPIGQAAILGAQRLGAGLVVVSEPAESRRRIAAELGAVVIDPTSADLGGDIARLTEGRGVSTSIDAVGTSGTLSSAIAATRRGGTVVLVGMNSTRLELGAYAITTEERSIVGAFCYSDAEFRSTAAWAATMGDRLDALISDVVPIESAPAAFRTLARGGDGPSKILVRFHDR